MRATIPTEEEIQRCHKLILIDPIIQVCKAELERIESMSLITKLVITKDGEVSICRVTDERLLPTKSLLEKGIEDRIELLKSKYLE